MAHDSEFDNALVTLSPFSPHSASKSNYLGEQRKGSLVTTKSPWAYANVNGSENMKTKVGWTMVKESEFSHSPTNNAQNIMRASQIVRAQLLHAAAASSGAHSPTPSNDVVVDTEEKKKAREMLQAQLLRASASTLNNDVVSMDTLRRQQLLCASTMKERLIPSLKNHRFNHNDYAFDKNTNRSHFSQSQPMSDVDEGIEIFCFGSDKTLQKATVTDISSEAVNEVEVISDNEYDGRIHSFPYKKNGPYTCPKCSHVFGTSQRFAAHVSSSHYKYESKAQRKKRLMAKIRGKSFQLHRVNDGLTFVPVPSSKVVAAGNNSNHGGAMVKVEAVEVGAVEVASPLPGKELGVKIKLEPVDS
ncbi:uncharacterized protein LOC113873287 [Abrus precatorius]|uniref:Uncharacterized protein LOC113873287 n=1 Tax=Abrus precatorius TaxID=3816 RepID=A0A8B8MEY6_ABRPR|nr:uncharacterized protein LOC113873287 [Abrus precatorius]